MENNWKNCIPSTIYPRRTFIWIQSKALNIPSVIFIVLLWIFVLIISWFYVGAEIETFIQSTALPLAPLSSFVFLGIPFYDCFLSNSGVWQKLVCSLCVRDTQCLLLAKNSIVPYPVLVVWRWVGTRKSAPSLFHLWGDWSISQKINIIILNLLAVQIQWTLFWAWTLSSNRLNYWFPSFRHYFLLITALVTISLFSCRIQGIDYDPYSSTNLGLRCSKGYMFLSGYECLFLKKSFLLFLQ